MLNKIEVITLGMNIKNGREINPIPYIADLETGVIVDIEISTPLFKNNFFKLI